MGLRPADASELLVRDAHELSTVAAVQLPRRVPGGIHGFWIPAEALTP
ncbi:carotenoid oxygenase family protein [Nocardia sp. NPDC052316]